MKRIFLLKSIVVSAIAILLVSMLFGCQTVTATTAVAETTAAAAETTAAAAETTAVAKTTAAAGGNVDIQALYDEVAQLQGEEALAFFNSLAAKGLSESDILTFFVDLPISQANQGIYKLFQDEGFETSMKSYPPRTGLYDDWVWKKGMGTEIVGEYSGLTIKLPHTDYIPVPEGPIGDPNKTYKIGFSFFGFDHPWLVNYADAARWEANRHPNVEMDLSDSLYDPANAAKDIDRWIVEKVDGIIMLPMTEGPSGPPAQRAVEAGIPFVESERLTSFDGSKVETPYSRVEGNFPANGAQCGMYLIWKLAQEGEGLNANMVLLRKPLGSTADAVRTGHMLKVLSYFPGITILQSYHDTDNREEAFRNAQNALQAYDNIDVFFGTGDHEALAALEATKAANRMLSREGGKKIIFLSIDDSKEALTYIIDGDIEVNTPYTALEADVTVRVMLKILAGEKMPYNVSLPDLRMVTKNGEKIFGLQTLKPEEWFEYTFGPPLS